MELRGDLSQKLNCTWNSCPKPATRLSKPAYVGSGFGLGYSLFGGSHRFVLNDFGAKKQGALDAFTGCPV